MREMLDDGREQLPEKIVSGLPDEARDNAIPSA